MIYHPLAAALALASLAASIGFGNPERVIDGWIQPPPKSDAKRFQFSARLDGYRVKVHPATTMYSVYQSDDVACTYQDKDFKELVTVKTVKGGGETKIAREAGGHYDNPLVVVYVKCKANENPTNQE